MHTDAPAVDAPTAVPVPDHTRLAWRLAAAVLFFGALSDLVLLVLCMMELQNPKAIGDPLLQGTTYVLMALLAADVISCIGLLVLRWWGRIGALVRAGGALICAAVLAIVVLPNGFGWSVLLGLPGCCLGVALLLLLLVWRPRPWRIAAAVAVFVPFWLLLSLGVLELTLMWASVR